MSLVENRKLFIEKKLFTHDSNNFTKWDFAHQMMDRYHKMLWEYSEYIRQTDMKEILITRDTVLFKLDDNDIILECLAGDERSMPMDIINFKTYEKEDLDLIDQLLNCILSENGSIIDIGANIGYTALHWGKKFPDIKIYAFEPLEPTFQLLSKNLKYNSSQNVYIYNLGLSNINREVEFVYYPWCIANSSLENLEEREDAQRIKGEIRRFDDIDKFQKMKVDFIKCDVEGNEKFVFEGMMDCIRVNLPMICAELLRKYALKFEYHPNDVLNMLKEIGYVCLGIGRGSLLLLNDLSNVENTNFLFLHKKKHKDIIKYIKEEMGTLNEG